MPGKRCAFHTGSSASWYRSFVNAEMLATSCFKACERGNILPQPKYSGLLMILSDFIDSGVYVIFSMASGREPCLLLA